MPSGAKKRKAAKRKKEQEQQQQQLGIHPPGSVTLPTAVLPPGNGAREEEDDLMSHDGKGSDSGSDFASPTAGGHHTHPLGVEEEQAETRVEAKSEDDSDPPVPADIKVDATVDGDQENRSETLAVLEKTEERAKKTEEEATVAAVDAKEDEIALLPRLDPVPHDSLVVPISEPEAVSVEQVQSEKDKDVVVSGEVRQPIAEEVVQASDLPIESLRVVDSPAVAPPDKNEVKPLPLKDATSEQLISTVTCHPGTWSYQTAGNNEVDQSAQLGQRASWTSCCGLFDVIVGTTR